MEFAGVEVHLYAHHSDTPENSSNEKIAKKDALLDGNFSKHQFKHVSNPPEEKVML